MADEKFRFPLTMMEPLTQNWGGSVIDTFALGLPGTVQKPNFVIFHNGRQEIRIFADNHGTLDPKLWGVSNWHFCSRTTRDSVKTQFVIFHNGWWEILFSIVQGTMEPLTLAVQTFRFRPTMMEPLCGVGNWHFCSRTTRDRVKPQFCDFS